MKHDINHFGNFMKHMLKFPLYVVVLTLCLVSFNPFSPSSNLVLAVSPHQPEPPISELKDECPEGEFYAAEAKEHTSQEAWLRSIKTYLAALTACTDFQVYLDSLSSGLDSSEESLALDPLNVETYWLVANYHFEQANYQAVVDLLDPAIVNLERADQTDNLHILFNFLAAAQVQLGLLEEALTAFEKMEEIDPLNIDTITKIFLLSKDLGQFDYDSILPRLERATAFLENATPDQRLAYHRLLAELYENAEPRPFDPIKYEKFLELALSLLSDQQLEQLIQDGGESGTALARHAKLRERVRYMNRPY